MPIKTMFNGGVMTIDGVPMYEISEFSFDTDIVYDYAREYVKKNHIICINNGKLVVRCTMTLNKLQLFKLIGLFDWAHKWCPDRRVAHLMKHGKNVRVRLKNVIRGVRMICKYTEELMTPNELREEIGYNG